MTLSTGSAPHAAPLAAGPYSTRAAARTRTIGVNAAAVGVVGLTGVLLLTGDVAAVVSSTGELDYWLLTLLLARAVLAGAFGLLAFYGVRLLVQAKPSATIDVKPALLDNLRKIRGIFAACLLLAIISVTGGLSAMGEASPGRGTLYYTPRSTRYVSGAGGGTWNGLPMALLYAVCAAACGIAVGNVRKALAEFVEPEEARGRGFAVSLVGAETPVPVAQPIADDGAPARVTSVPALAAVTPAPVAVAAPALPHAAREDHRDLRTLVHGIAVAGIIYWTVQLPLTQGVRDPVAYGRLIAVILRAGGPNTPGETEKLFAAARALAAFLLLIAGAWWILWGVLCLVRGPSLRRTALVAAWITAAATAAVPCLSFYAVSMQTAYVGREELNYGRGRVFADLAVRLFYPAALLTLLTRPSVKPLFKHGSEAGEELTSGV